MSVKEAQLLFGSKIGKLENVRGPWCDAGIAELWPVVQTELEEVQKMVFAEDAVGASGGDGGVGERGEFVRRSGGSLVRVITGEIRGETPGKVRFEPAAERNH